MAEIGKPIDRVDARLKVTGAAKYAAEFSQKNVAYAYPVRATISKGSVASFDLSAAKKSNGVLEILTHENAQKLRAIDPEAMQETGGQLGEELVPLQDNEVFYWGQYIGLVIAQTYEQASAAAALVSVKYNEEKPATNLNAESNNSKQPQKWRGKDVQVNEGMAAGAINDAAVKVENTYSTSTENHHPMEPHATIAIWEGKDRLTIYEATQGVIGAAGVMAYLFNLQKDSVQILSPYVGGGFGCKGSVWGHLPLTAMAAQAVNRPVKLAITRQMMQTNVGRRPETHQTVALATGSDGSLTAIRHHNYTYGNLADFYEESGKPSLVLYKAPIREITYKVDKLNIGTPTYMRAPGETPGTFALESAMDELAFELKMDPIALRVLNHTSENPMSKLPFSSEYIKECYQVGADKFGWSKRKAVPRQVKNGKYLVGYGMATATYPAIRSAASAKIQMMADGSVTVMSATQDIGTGTYTIMAQTAADALGIPLNKITVKIGDSSLPPAPVSGGSATTASVNPAVLAAGEMLRDDLLKMAAIDNKSPLKGRRTDEITFTNGRLYVKGDKSKNDSYTEIMRRNKKDKMEVCATAMHDSGGGVQPPCMAAPQEPGTNGDASKYSFHSFGAQFAEVWVDEDLGTIRVKRFLSVQDIGTVMNEKTARSQIIGGVVYGIGEALMEKTDYDERWANPTTRTLADYHVPINLDVPQIEVHFIGKPDPHISKIGARGIGEIGTTGTAAAIANAVFNATGKRLRHLPLTPDKMFT